MSIEEQQVPARAGSFSRRNFLGLSMVGGATLFLAGAAGSGVAEAARTGRAGAVGAGTLRVAVASDPGGFDQDYLAFDTVGLSLMKNFMPFCIDYPVVTHGRYDAYNTNRVVPIAAESWSSDATGKVWTLKLRKGLKFPSGNPMTAADVKWSKDRAFAAKANVAGVYAGIGLTKPSQVRVLDAYTVQFHQAFASALTNPTQVISLYVFDSKLLKEHATAGDPWAKAWASKHPTNGGLYNLTSYQPGSQIVMELNGGYPLSAYGAAAKPFPKVIVDIIPDDASRLLQLQRGAIDVAFGLSQQDTAKLAKRSGVTVLNVPSDQYVSIPMLTSTAPFNNKRVRQAMAWAMPYKEILDAVYGGKARRSTSVLPLGMPGASPKGYPFTTNLAKAKSLLAAAGMSSGFTTSIGITAGNQAAEEIAVLTKANLAQLGVTLNIEELDPATLSQDQTNKTLPMQIVTGQLWVNDVQYLLSTSLIKGAFLNYADYDNPAVQAIFEKLTATTAESGRMKLAAQLQAILADDVPWLMLGQPDLQVPMRSDIEGWVEGPDELFRLPFFRKV
ncbi:MAG: transporter substrate-binding protein [Acidimicrobiaceae bacterium]|nr:transporter substrate-binding protein [Acidimicrobiaceae bacterium]